MSSGIELYKNVHVDGISLINLEDPTNVFLRNGPRNLIGRSSPKNIREGKHDQQAMTVTHMFPKLNSISFSATN